MGPAPVALLDDEQFEQHDQTLLEWKEKLQARLDEIEEVLEEYQQVEVSLQAVKEALSRFDELWEEGTLEQRKQLLGELVGDLQVTTQGGAEAEMMEEEEIPIKCGS